MRSRALGTVLVVLGVLLLAAAAVLTYVVVPTQKVLPADTDTTRQYEGTAKVLLNPQALLANDPANVFVTNIPVTATRTVKVLVTDGNVAKVNDSRALTAGGQAIGKTEATYAVDRRSLEAAEPLSSDWAVVDHTGLTVSWPIGAEKRNYTGWVNETQTSAPVHFVRQEQRGGIDTYVYTGSVPPSPIKDPQVLAALPPALPPSVLASLATVLPLPEALKAQLAAILPTLTQPVPLAYTYEASSTYWVEPTTGVVVDSEREEIRKAGLVLPGVPAPVGSIVVYDVVTKGTSQSVADAVNDAVSGRDTINLYGRTLPLILVVLGALALVGGVVMIVRSRRARPTG